MLCNTAVAYLCVNSTRNLCFASVPNLSIHPFQCGSRGPHLDLSHALDFNT